MYVSLSQVVTSLERLEQLHVFFGFGFLGFKKAGLKVGATEHFSYNFITNQILDEYFKPIQDEEKYFNPFKSNTRWINHRYASTSLQRVIADTFGAAFIHKKGESEWGWKDDYVQILADLGERNQSSKISVLDLAVWLYRGSNLSDQDPRGDLIARFISEFNIVPAELDALCDDLADLRLLELSDQPASDADILNYVGWPEGWNERSGVILKALSLENLGPCRRLQYMPSQRLNVITGDNSLGKTFLLDSSWWALTGEWAAYPAEPRGRGRSQIEYTVASSSGRIERFISPFSRFDSGWQRASDPFEGLGIYARHSGDVAIWDPVGATGTRRGRYLPHVILSRSEIWEGSVREDSQGRRIHVSNGLVRDWLSWQLGERGDQDTYKLFEHSLRELSPPDARPIASGRPVNIPGDSRLIPTVRLPYGTVPILYASAGIQRIVMLAYVIVWHWRQHLERCELLGREPLRQMVVILDEIEAHLHPKWQRQILPALLRTMTGLSPAVRVQMHVATHSPLVLASLETDFDEDCDQLHHIEMNNEGVRLNQFSFSKQGTVDAWLESDLFGLGDARSRGAEEALDKARALQEAEDITVDKIYQITQLLLRSLPDDDPFWVRWNLFRRTYGAVGSDQS